VSVLALDIGGTRIKAGLVEAGRVTATRSAPTDASGVAATVLEQLVSLGRQIVQGATIEAVGACVRGIVDPRAGGMVDVNPPLRCLIGEPLAAFLAAEFGAPAAIENDARAYALGELRHGAGRGVGDLVCITLGTGIGVGVAVGGRMVRGPRGMWGILGGHFTVAVDGPLCNCGNRGCLEALIGSQALVDDATARLRAAERSSLREEGLDPLSIFAAAAAGDPVATATVDRFTTVLGSGVVSLVHAYDPDLVVIGGGLSGSAAQYLPRVREYVTEHAWTYPKGRVQIDVAELGDSAALVGAAELATDDTWAWRWPE
jgi:glucokinase